MEFTPFTLEEATEICEDFEDLSGTECKIGRSPVLLIENIVIAPFSDQDKNIFFDNYFQTNDSRQSLGFYKGNEYDVILITCESGNNYAFIDIRKFAELKGIRYSFPEKISR